MKKRLLTVAIERETDIVVVRERTRKITALAGFDRQDQTRITTAVSEIARNAWEYGKGGRVEYWLSGDKNAEELEIVVVDKGAGIADLDAVLSGSYKSQTGMGVGILGARRLMDSFVIESAKGTPTTVRMAKPLPRRASNAAPIDPAKLAKSLATDVQSGNPLDEIRQQNQEIMAQLQELNDRQEQLKQLNQELEETNRGVVALYAELDERADHLRRADELKSKFLSNMSHEFRTPLNSILALSRLLLTRSDGELSNEQEKQVQFIRKGAETLTELINDLLDLAKVEAGKTVVTPANFTISSLFGALRGMLRPLLVGERVALVFEDAFDLPQIYGDEAKVSQILRNFISNALKFTEAGEVRVWAQADSEDTITIFVRDTGIGIEPQNLDLIWQEFGQVQHALQSKIKGTGLGLPLSRRLAELLGGQVGVESEPGEGSVFRLTLPRVYRRSVEDAQEDNWRVVPGLVPILSVEDDEADRFAIERSFRNTHYQIISVRSLSEARRALDRIAPAAVLLDVTLMGEDSWRFLIEQKTKPLTQQTPIVVVSSGGEERKARSLGADEFLHKPIDPNLLRETVDQMTGQHSSLRVLVVDDEEVFHYLVRQLLPRGAFDLVHASSAQEGLRMASEDQPNVVLVDLNMQAMNGFEMISRLTADTRTSNIPIVVLTSLHMNDEYRRRLKPASAILSKANLSTELLVTTLRDATQDRAQA